ncbi:MAG TPA: VOC family protein [Acidimicrobiia bacterium]|nr:VOC family protein [Acidimicrobiia bacterium]
MFADSPVAAVLPTHDLEESRTWWRDKVGMEPAHEDLGGLWYSCGEGTWFLVTPSQFAGTAQNTAASFKVSDVHAVMAEMRRRGVTFEDYDLEYLKTVNGVFEYQGYRAAWFKDNAGNIIEMAQVPSNPS